MQKKELVQQLEEKEMDDLLAPGMRSHVGSLVGFTFSRGIRLWQLFKCVFQLLPDFGKFLHPFIILKFVFSVLVFR